MSHTGSPLSVVLVGAESLLIHCGERLITAGHRITRVISTDDAVHAWAVERRIPFLPHSPDLGLWLGDAGCDILLSIGNRRILDPNVVALARLAAINFHDGPLPRYSGLNAPNWAIFDGATEHGITWHVMTERADAGGILISRKFPIQPDDTARTLNARCFEAGIDSFEELLGLLATRSFAPVGHEIDMSTRHGRVDVPLECAAISFALPAAKLNALARSLDFGPYTNPIALPRLNVAGSVCAVAEIRQQDWSGDATPGSILSTDDDGVTVACADGAVRLGGIVGAFGRRLDPALLRPGSVIPEMPPADQARIGQLLRQLGRNEDHWISRLQSLRLPNLGAPTPVGGGAARGKVLFALPDEAIRAWDERGLPGGNGDYLVAAFGAFLIRCGYAPRGHGNHHFDVMFSDDSLRHLALENGGWMSPYVPLRFQTEGVEALYDVIARTNAELELSRLNGSFAFDLPLRVPGAEPLRGAPGTGTLVLVEQLGKTARMEERPPAALALVISASGEECTFEFDGRVFTDAVITRMAERFTTFLAGASRDWNRDLGSVPILAAAERAAVNERARRYTRPTDLNVCVHELVQQSAVRYPETVALRAADGDLTYAELDTRANQLARFLISRGIGLRSRVAVCFERSLNTVVSILGVLKAGAAYVPVDPSHPAERTAFILEDSNCDLLLTSSAIMPRLPSTGVPALALDVVSALVDAEMPGPPDMAIDSSELAYVIYTSGSTGRPKGVMVEHRNVVNLFGGLDERIGVSAGDVWLAVTSLSFDISVLELLWTLTRGLTVVIHAESGQRMAAAAGNRVAMDFSLFYFSADAGDSGADAYRLLLEGAKFADQHGFSAVWTPERHFHEFGGLYPNPSITAAAVAAITRHVGIRAGSVVLPLHHPLRVAEEWSVVDNISNGRVGISFASGWQPNDFVIKPEAYKDNKSRMLEGIETVRKLWRGESLSFPGPLGNDVAVRTLPRPVQKDLPSWITTAGNPETYRIAGEKGLRVLTHLLGQSKEELRDKIAVYREAWRAAGHPGAGYVTLMLHTFVSDDEDHVREMVREPLRNYLRSSVSLIKDFAATFPALKKRGDGAELDFKSLSAEEMDALLDYSVERYYETSGLFGSPGKCSELVNDLAAMGVNEIACLIDFGVGTNAALAALEPLNVLRSLFQPTAAADGTSRVAPLGEMLRRHSVTHMQCTPSLARLLVADTASHGPLRGLKGLLVGGEAFPPRLASELRAITGDTVEIHNMYGPTETTVWSTSHRVTSDGGSVPIGTPLANTTVYVVDEFGQLAADGSTGELWIGGAGVARGYHNRDELSAARFTLDPFLDEDGARVYRTGDLARFDTTTGVIEYLGRADDQVKILGHRIELAEVEAALELLPGVQECAAGAAGDSENGQHLEAFIVASERCPSDAVLREKLRAHLPEAMLPTRFVRVPRLPLNANGKVDRKALVSLYASAPSRAAPDGGRGTRNDGPSSELETRIAAIWSEVLGVRNVGMTENFFDIGGHSLLAVRVHSRLKQDFAGDLSITDLFRYSTVRSLAAHIAGRNGDEGAAAVAAAARDRGAMRRGAQQLRKPRSK